MRRIATLLTLATLAAGTGPGVVAAASAATAPKGKVVCHFSYKYVRKYNRKTHKYQRVRQKSLVCKVEPVKKKK
jgi:hypothetical protein